MGHHRTRTILNILNLMHVEMSPARDATLLLYSITVMVPAGVAALCHNEHHTLEAVFRADFLCSLQECWNIRA